MIIDPYGRLIIGVFECARRDQKSKKPHVREDAAEFLASEWAQDLRSYFDEITN